MNSLKLLAFPALLVLATGCGDLRTSSSELRSAQAQPATAGAEAQPTSADLGLTTGANFQAVGRSYYQSTGCSPHSTSLDLKIERQALTVKYSEMVGSYSLYVMQLAAPHTIAQTIQPARYGLPDDATAQALSPGNSTQDPAYRQALEAMRTAVVQLRDGNVCFPARPELTDVADYLNQL